MASSGCPAFLADYGARASTIWAAGEEVQAAAGDVEHLSADVHVAHLPARDGVAGLLDGPMTGAEVPVRLRAYEWLRTSLFAGGAIHLFGTAVDTYNAGVARLRTRWEAAVANDAETTEMRSILRWEQLALCGELDSAADMTAWRLAAGPDIGSVREMYQAGALPLGAPAVFPEVNFFGLDPYALFQHLVDQGKVPAELLDDGTTAEEVADYLDDRPEIAPFLALLLGAPILTGRESTLLHGLGIHDGRQLRTGVTDGRLDQVSQSIDRLRDINGRIGFAPGVRLSLGDIHYLTAFFDAAGADAIAALPGVVEDQVFPGPDAARTRDLAAQDYLVPVANAIMNLSNPDVGGISRFDAMPQSIQDLVNTEIGYVDEEGRRWMSPDTEYPHSWPIDGIVVGVDRYTGFAELLGASTVDGGTDFTFALGESALRVKQDLAAIAGTQSHFLGMSGPAQGNYAEVAQERRDAIAEAIHDEGPSRMLSVVARNEDASALLLLVDEDRRTLLGIAWEDASGAADVVRAGADRDPTDGGGTKLQADAALALIQDVGGDRDAYLARMTEDVSDAVVDVGIQWIDAFAAIPGPGEHVSTVGAYPDPLDVSALRLALTTEDQRNFLEYIAGTGSSEDDPDLLRFGGAAHTYAVTLVSEAMETGNARQINGALEWAAHLDGSLTASVYEYRLDQAQNDYERELAAHEADVNRRRWVTLGVKLAVGATFSFSNAGMISMATQAGNTTLAGVAGSVFGTGGAGINQAVDDVFAMPEPPEYLVPRTADQLFNADRIASSPERSYLLLAAANRAGIDPIGFDTEVSRSGLSALYQHDESGAIARDAAGRPVLRTQDQLFAGRRDGTDPMLSLSAAADGSVQALENRIALANEALPPAQHSPASVNVAEHHDKVWGDFANGTYGRDIRPPDGSPWHNASGAQRILYGARNVDPNPPRDGWVSRPTDPEGHRGVVAPESE